MTFINFKRKPQFWILCAGPLSIGTGRARDACERASDDGAVPLPEGRVQADVPTARPVRDIRPRSRHAGQCFEVTPKACPL